MKQLLFITILFLILDANYLKAQTKYNEETTWNVIRGRLFDGKRSKAFRYEEDIRFQLKGSVNKQDSTIFEELVSELNSLTESVEVKLVNKGGNFIITILQPNDGLGLNIEQQKDGYKITHSEIDFNLRYISNIEEKRRDYYYYTIRNLTVLFNNPNEVPGYGGIFYYNDKPEYVLFYETDKDLIRKLYSNDFYDQLRKNTTKNWGYLYYLNFRFSGWVKTISTLIIVLLTIIGFLFLLSKESASKPTPRFWEYFKNGCLVLIGLSLIMTFYALPTNIELLRQMNIFLFLVLGFVGVFPHGIMVIILMYYSEKYFLPKFSKFLQKQVFIFASTFLLILISYAVFSLPFVFLNSQHTSTEVNYTQHLNLSIFYQIILIACLRVFYNFITFRMQSMVNQKDVELAKMKELKNQAELNALHSRINPHFLYNSLNSIAVLAHTNPDKTENMATGLSELFRYSINKENKTFVTVTEELEMVEKYLEIEKTRFGKRLLYKIEVDESAQEKQIPKFLIQPLAENAIKHGLSKSKQTGKVSITVKQIEEDLIISIFDNGPDFPDEPVSGYGLQNLHDKLEIIYGENASINWENGENKHFRITLKNQFQQK